MRVTCDPEVDALYIRLLEGDHQCRILRLTDEISLNIGKDEVLVGTEILSTRDVLGATDPLTVVENVIAVTA